MESQTSKTIAAKSNVMMKWGVRLLSILFFAMGISQVWELIFAPENASGFFGLKFYLASYNGVGQFDILGWVYAYLLFYTGFQLMKFNNTGRMWALILFWPTAIVNGIIFTIMLVMFFFPSIYEWFPFGVSPTLPWCNCKVETPLGILLFIAIAFAYSLIPLYFLLRKDTKALFQKPATTGETNLPPIDGKEQSL